MNTDSFLLLASILITALLITASKPNHNKDTYIQKAQPDINKQFQEDLIAFKEEVARFAQITPSDSQEAITKGYITLRRNYKRIEFAIEYLDDEAMNRFINGAPLPKLEQKVAEHVVLAPKGLQVIDELMADLSSDQAKLELVEQAKLLNNNANRLVSFLKNKSLTERQLFEASRMAIVRLITLGITGFDTPGTTLGVKDAQTVLESLEVYLNYFKNELNSIGQAKLLVQYNQITKYGLEFINGGDFESFDRAVFIKEVANPLFNLILKMHLALGYETIEEVTRFLPAVNYYSQNIFASNFLDSQYYVSLPVDSLTSSRAALGKLLFYDPILSGDNSMSCASCHNPKLAFTDGQARSLSNNGEPLQRNALTLNYSLYASGYFHDLRTKRLEDQFEHVVVSEKEFNTSYRQLTEKLESSPTYVNLFKDAFPNQKRPIKFNNIDYALTAYVMQLNKFDSAIDLYFNEATAILDQEILDGFNLFTGKAACATCHFMPLFSGIVPPLYKETESEVLGVPQAKQEPWILDKDMGRWANGLNKEKADFYKNSFKTPTLRNIALTAPYMHNGVFETLEEVMDFYNLGGGAGRGLDIPHQTLAPDHLQLTNQEINAIIVFMRALTDSSQFAPPQSLPTDFKISELNDRLLSR